MVGERVTVMGAVPAMYEIIAGQAGGDELGLRLAFSGGAALKRPVFDAVRERLGVTLRQDYGSTEASMFSHNDSVDPDSTWDSVGRPAGDATARIIALDTAYGPAVGEMEIRDPALVAFHSPHMSSLRTAREFREILAGLRWELPVFGPSEVARA